MIASRTTGLSALLTVSAVGLAAMPSSPPQTMLAGSLGLAAAATALSLRELSRGKGRPEQATMLLMVQAVVLAKGICQLGASNGL